MPSAPTVDVVIAVHDPTRPLLRAVESVVADGVDGVRVLVVCHGLPRTAFRDTQSVLGDAPVEWIEFTDGVRSPTGPFMHGLRVATAEYVTIMGSDDYLEPGAVATAVDRLRHDDPDVLVLPLRHQSGELLRNPLSRKGHVRGLDPIRDRLAYRTAPLAYMRRRLLPALDLELTPDVPAGEDIDFTAKLWLSGARIDFHPADPAYVIGADADTRVTTAARPASVELTALRLLFAAPWIGEVRSAAQMSLMIKILRIHVLGPVVRRAGAGELSVDDVRAYAEVVRTGVGFSRRAVRPFSRADRAILEALAAVPLDPSVVVSSARAHPSASRFARLIPRNPLLAFHREGAIRRFLRYRTWP